MALATYSDLKASIARWLFNRDDLADAIPDFIALCETTLNYGAGQQKGLRVAEMEKMATITANPDGTMDLPADFLEMRTVDVGVAGYNAVELVGAGAPIGDARVSGVPQRFVISGNDLTAFPKNGGTLKIVYYAKIPALSDASPTNWLLTKSPGVYLYGSLLHAAPYLSEDERTQTWTAMYAAHLGGLQSTDFGARFSLGRVRVRGPLP